MNKITTVTFLFLILSLLPSCTFQKRQIGQLTDPKVISNEINDNLKVYKVKKINLDYIARCKIQIKSKTENQSGSCRVIVSRSGTMKISLFSPIGGTVFVFYMDEEIIQALDQIENVFYQLRNTQKNRLKVFTAINFNVKEFQSIIWGRETDWVKNRLNFNYNQGKPYQVQSIGRNRSLVVTYKKWLLYDGAWFPKLFLIEDIGKQISVKMVITEFLPGAANDLKIRKMPSGYHTQSDI